MRTKVKFICGLLLLVSGSAAQAQQATVYSGCGVQSWATGFSRPLGINTSGDLCVSLSSSGSSLVGVKGSDGATIASPTNPLPETLYDSHGTQTDFTAATLVTSTSGYPQASTPITGNAAGTTGAVVGTLAATAGKTTYICGFNVSAVGGTAAVGPITIAGLKGSSMVYQLTSSTTGVDGSNATVHALHSGEFDKHGYHDHDDG